MGLGGRLTSLAARPHLPRRTVRLRLTALYGALFLASGIALLTVTYLLVSRATGDCQSVQEPSGRTVTLCVRGMRESVTAGPAGVVDAPTQQFQAGPENEAPPELTQEQKKAQALLLEEQAKAQRDAQMHQLLVNSGVALGAMAIVSIGLGWVVAGRALRPLRTITSTARRISATSLHERLAMTGPDDELKELADTFDGLLARLERSFEAQRRFVANASHELRTPLARQRTVAQVALADPGATVESLRAAHERVIAAGEEQERLIDALLTLARGQAGLRMRELVDLSGVMNDVLVARQAEAVLRGIDVRPTLSPASASGDRRLVERLIANLVENALSYNRPEGHIDLLVGTRDGHGVVSVTNTGPVVPAAEVERLLQPFQRNGPDRVGRGRGLGLGLSIVRAIAEAHDASLDVRPLSEGGLVVEVTFPAVPATNGGEPTRVSEPSNQNGERSSAARQPGEESAADVS